MSLIPQIWYYSPYHNKICDVCKTRIKGNRYECLSCTSFNMCESCFSNSPITLNHRKSHCVTKILSDLDIKALDVHSCNCDGCSTKHFTGIRYTCDGCINLNLCQQCYERPNYEKFPPSHTSSDAHKIVKHDADTKHKYENYMARAIYMQNEIGYGLSQMDWSKRDLKNLPDWIDLGKKIGYAYYREPTEVPSEGMEQYGYGTEKDKHISDTIRILIKLNENNGTVYVKFVFASFFNVSTHVAGTLALIRMKAFEDNAADWFVEPGGRTYSGWKDFKNKNMLPEGCLVYPDDFVYKVGDNGLLNLAVDVTANAHTTRKFAEFTDMSTGITCTTVGIIAGIGLLTPFAPLASTALLFTGIVGGGYGASRGAYKLIDRRIHNESIAPTNLANFFDWMSIVGTAASFGAMGTMAYASRGVALSQTARVAVNSVLIGNMAISGVGISVSTGLLIKKVYNGEKITPLELVQAMSSFIFFAVSVKTFKSANDLVTQGAQNKIKQERSSLKTDTERANFDDMLNRKVQEDGHLQGSLKFLDELKAARMEGTFENKFSGTPSKAGGRHAAPTNAYVKNKDGSTHGINTDTNVYKEQHMKATGLRKQTNLAPSKQSPTTIIDMSPDALEARVKYTMETGKGGKVESHNYRGQTEHIVTIDFGNEPHPGAHVTSTADGPQVQRVLIRRFSVVVDLNGEPVHLNSAGTHKVDMQRSEYQNLKIVPAYIDSSGECITLHGVISPVIDEDEEIPIVVFASKSQADFFTS